MPSTATPDLPKRTGRSILPSLCAVCHGWGRHRVCADCTGRYATPTPRCRHCALEVAEGQAACGTCLVDPPAWDRALAAVSYGYPWDRLIAAFKFHAALDAAPAFVELLLAAQRRSAAPAPALLLPVPLSAERLRERGYNQAWELARRLAREMRCRAEPALLLRIRDTPHQLALPPERRAANVRGAFAVARRRDEALRGARIALVDDVMTSGATAAECARVLYAAGAQAVDIWVVARTPKPGSAE